MRLRRIGLILAGVAIATIAAAEPVRPPATPAAADIPPIARHTRGFDLALLAPVDGVGPRQYEHATAALVYGAKGDEAAILAKLGLDKARYDAAAKVFTQRMIGDPTSVLNMILGAYYDEAAQGRYAALGRDVSRSVLEDAALREKPPLPEARWNALQVYYARKAPTLGGSPEALDAMLKPYGLTELEFQVISNWYGRRDTMPKAAKGRLPPQADVAPPAAAADDATPERNHPEWGGLWHFEWANLKQDPNGIGAVKASRDICMKSGMTADELPLMPRAPGARCALGYLAFYDSRILLSAQCDHGDYGVEWGLILEPITRGEAYRGRITYEKRTEKTGGLPWPNPDTRVVALRRGDC